MINFVEDKELNKHINEYLEEVIQKDEGGISESEKTVIKIYVEDLITQLPFLNIENIITIINCAYVGIKINKLNAKKDPSQKDIELISRMSSTKATLLKNIGLDAKTMQSRRKNALGDDIFSIVRNSKHFKKSNKIGNLEAARKLMTPLDNSTDIPKGRMDKFDRMSEDKIVKFLKTA